MQRERVARAGAPLAALLLAAALLCGCAGTFGFEHGHTPPPPSPVDPAIAAATRLSHRLEVLQRLIEGTPAEQAAILADAKHDYDLAPAAPGSELDYALVLAAPGHAGSNPAQARQLLSSALASGTTLQVPERALAVMVMQEVDRQLDLVATNERLRTEQALDARQREAETSRRLKAQVEENVRLRRDLERARAKLRAITNIERSLNNRRKSAPPAPQPPPAPRPPQAPQTPAK
ncbi:MAG: hypothetical protein ACRETB_08740 [Steroidobacteraceae bacterium]